MHDIEDAARDVSRRRILRRLFGAAVVGTAGTLLDQGSADAATGDAILAGGDNTAGRYTSLTCSDTNSALWVLGQASSGVPYTAAVLGDTNAYNGLAGITSASGFVGVYGQSHAASAHSQQPAGVSGNSDVYDGVIGQSDSGYGVHGISTISDGVRGLSTNAGGVVGNSTHGAGVVGGSQTFYGLSGTSDSGIGVYGISNTGTAVEGSSVTSNGGVFQTYASGKSALVGIGQTVSGIPYAAATVGDTSNYNGVAGLTSADGHVGVFGVSHALDSHGQSPAGVAGHSDKWPGVLGQSNTNNGVTGISSSAIGVRGTATAHGGVGVAADGSGGAIALHVTGVAKFSRSGIATIAAGSTHVTVPGVALTVSSAVLATLQHAASGNGVSSAVPNVTGSSVTITLLKAATTTLKVAWFVLG